MLTCINLVAFDCITYFSIDWLVVHGRRVLCKRLCNIYANHLGEYPIFPLFFFQEKDIWTPYNRIFYYIRKKLITFNFFFITMLLKYVVRLMRSFFFSRD